MSDFLLSNFELVILGVLAFVLLAGVACIVGLLLMLRGMKQSLDELRRARIEIRSHSAMRAAQRVPYEERLKAEYEKRGIPWETTGKS
jgi:hypothetical protein